MEETAAVRKAEAARSAAMIGAEYICLDYDDEKFFDNMCIMAEFRGMQAQCKYAEGFVRALDGMRTRMTERVLP